MVESNSGLSSRTLLIALGTLVALSALGGAYYMYSAPKPIKKKQDTAVKDKENVPENVKKETSTNEKVEAKSERPAAPSSVSKKQDLADYTKEKLEELAAASRTKGNRYYNAGKYDKAIECYSESIRLYPEDCPDIALAYSNRAACYLRLEDFPNVIEDCTEALKAQPKNIKALDRRIKALESEKRYEEACVDILSVFYIEGAKNMELVDKLSKHVSVIAEEKVSQIKEFPHKFPTPSLVYDRLITFQDDYYVKDVVSSEVAEADSLIKAALEHMVLKDYESAFNELLKASKMKGLGAVEVMILSFLCTFYIAMNEYQEALYHIELAIGLDSKNSSLYIKRGVIYSELSQHAEAAEDFEKAISLSPTNFLPYYHRSNLYLMAANPLALTDAEKAVDLVQPAPNASPILKAAYALPFIQLSRFYFMNDDYHAGIAVIKKGLAKLKNDENLLFTHAEVLVAFPKFDVQVETELREILEILLKQARDEKTITFPCKYYMLKASEQIRKNKYTEAIATLKTAIEIEPDLQFPYFQMAMLYLAIQKNEEAVNYIKTSIERACNKAEVINAYRMLADIECQIKFAERYPELGEIMRKSLLNQ